MEKIFIDANQLQRQSFALAKLILDSNYRPSFIIGVWRGGAPIAITVHEVLDYFGYQMDHTCIKVSSYQGLDRRTQEIQIQDLTYLKKLLKENDNILIVDDVHDTGLSMEELIQEIRNETKVKTIKIAAAYYKPKRSKVNFKPDFYVQETSDWLVFPHELDGLSEVEVRKKAGIGDLLNNSSTDP
ncbi:MAG: hypothetical protein KTR16_04120 [Acidiferrobacterales bacterium]|nr:hypothetical protein [Acidiferrobacterales bacterium]